MSVSKYLWVLPSASTQCPNNDEISGCGVDWRVTDEPDLSSAKSPSPNNTHAMLLPNTMLLRFILFTGAKPRVSVVITFYMAANQGFLDAVCTLAPEVACGRRNGAIHHRVGHRPLAQFPNTDVAGVAPCAGCG